MFGAPFPAARGIEVNYLSTNTTLSASDKDRHVVVNIGWFFNTVSAVTIAGVGATILAQALSTLAGAMAVALIPAGASGSIVISGGAQNVAYDLYEVIGWEGSLVTTGTSTALPSSVAVVAPANSGVVALMACQDTNAGDPTATATWTNLTKNTDLSYGAGGARYLSSASRALETASSFTATCSDSHTGSLQVCVLATFKNA